jgi:hypothetical protein
MFVQCADLLPEDTLELISGQKQSKVTIKIKTGDKKAYAVLLPPR